MSFSNPAPTGLLLASDIPKITHTTPTVHFTSLQNGRWLTLEEASFIDPSGAERKWELCERVPQEARKRREDDVDAVDIVAVIRASSKAKFPSEDAILLVLQFRPPTKSWTLEFPSGLVDAKESVETAALRELSEETGFVGTISSVGPPITYEPGITSSCSRMVHVTINAEENQDPKPKQEDDEWSLHPCVFPLKNLLGVLHEVQERCKHLKVDSRLYSFASGLSLATS
ncbi:NUDIX hydrolase domain-like protein [Fimicolochytrium jonesii]|uniref:NUDIX hydrolase domain-like protein n=1 Tax=Fimicolochytrium jonesii TaxID=1396493 RepID=UPI0022FE70D8|nr:NUDIX hydrolase domain-like protein [Fimicolochytrium jonesii]KAI8819986.1 NUDIX hydrolase domain-like protein [Fimicolochytrium jonesii]